MKAARWACVVAALGAVAYLLLDPATADHAAQEYRAGLVRDHGLGLWNNGWYAGHHLPAYSLLSPALGALIGVRLAGALAAVAAAGLFGLVAERRWGPRAGSVAAAWRSRPRPGRRAAGGLRAPSRASENPRAAARR